MRRTEWLSVFPHGIARGNIPVSVAERTEIGYVFGKFRIVVVTSKLYGIEILFRIR